MAKAKANVILINSILWNLREVTKLAEKIKKHCGDVDCTSWRYPLTSCSELEIFKLLQNNRNLDSYTYILELTYDRLLYVFNLMIKYLESGDSLERFRPARNVSRPKTLSLAVVLHMLWDRIRAQAESAKDAFAGEEEEAEERGGYVQVKRSQSSTCTQSEVCSISVCSCCEMVQEFVTQLVLEMEKILEKQEFKSAISNQRKGMNEYLVEMTNWSAMSRWLTAIVKDLATLAERAEEATIRHRLDSGERRMKSRVEQHEEESRKLKTCLREHEARFQKMKEEMEEISKEKIRMCDEMKAKTAELAAKFENKIAEMKKSFEKKLEKKREKKLKKEAAREAEWKAKLGSECEKRRETETENEKLAGTLSKFRENLENLNSRIEEETNRCEDLKAVIQDKARENAKLNLIVGEKEKMIEDYSARMMAAFPDLSGLPKSKYKASGNAQIDMENQIEANNLRMETLKSENEKLKRTLEKLKSIKG